MERITRDHVIAYGRELASFAAAGTLSPSTAHNRVSSVNRVLEIARRDRLLIVSPTKDCGIPRRRRVAAMDKSMPAERYEALVGDERIPERKRVIFSLQWTLGLRMEEAMKLDAKRAVRQAEVFAEVEISDGTKGGRRRTVPAAEAQIKVLRWAASIQDGQSMIPRTMTYREYRARYLAVARRHGIRSHSLRHGYANRRHAEILGCLSPVAAGIKRGAAYYRYVADSLGVTIDVAKARVRNTRLQIARELGHRREDITSAYCG
jgi:site-specific recombinase XerC